MTGPFARANSTGRPDATCDAVTPPKNVKKSGRKPSPTSARAWRTRKEAALAQLRELQLKRERGRSLDAEQVAREWADILRTVRGALLAVVRRVRERLPHLTAQDAAVIDEEIRKALTALSEGREVTAAPDPAAAVRPDAGVVQPPAAERLNGKDRTGVEGGE